MGLASAGSPVRGRTGNAGDVGHLVVDPDGPHCPRCGGRGCLGVGIEPQTLLAAAGVEAAGESPAELRHALDDVVRRAEQGEARVCAALATTAERIAAGIVQTNNLLDLDRVVAGGLVWDRLAGVLQPLLAEKLQRSTASTATRPIALRETRLGTDVAAAGAACLVLDRVFTARPTNLLITV
jgi:predicted NBD/HSP70 family sugar kinase